MRRYALCDRTIAGYRVAPLDGDQLLVLNAEETTSPLEYLSRGRWLTVIAGCVSLPEIGIQLEADSEYYVKARTIHSFEAGTHGATILIKESK